MLLPSIAAGPLMALAGLWTLMTAPALWILRFTGMQPPSLAHDTGDSDGNDAPHLNGKVAIVSGSNTGIGKRTAAHLAFLGFKVIVACRNHEKGVKAVSEMKEEVREAVEGAFEPAVVFMHLDLSSTISVNGFADKFMESHKRLDVLVNNAGTSEQTKLPNGLNTSIVANVLGHFLLVKRLMPMITKTAGARVINLSSVMHHFGCTEWETVATCNQNWLQYMMYTPYATSKLAMVYFTQELRRRFQEAGVTATAFSANPGSVRSEIWRHVPPPWSYFYDWFMKYAYLNCDQGCFTSVATATMPISQLQSDYYQPYMLPLGPSYLLPFEFMGPFMGMAAGRPSLARGDNRDHGAKMWDAFERLCDMACKLDENMEEEKKKRKKEVDDSVTKKEKMTKTTIAQARALHRQPKK